MNEIVRLLDMGQSRVSRHLTILAQSGLAQSRREGLSVYYKVRPEGAVATILESLRELVDSDPEARSTADRDLSHAALAVQERGARSRQFFDARAGEWDRLAREVLGEVDVGSLVVDLMGHLRARPAVAVDIGCGTGALLDALCTRADRVIGVDSSPRMLERARRRFDGDRGVDLRLGEAEHLPLGDGEADLAVMSMTLHHLAEPEAGLREVSRVTGTAGAFVLAELTGHDREDLREEHGDRWLGFDREAVLAMAGQTGFTIVEERSQELPRGLRLGLYLFLKTTGGKKNGQRKDLRGS